ncbi:carbon-nitrogen hydrolase family protein [Streptomyces sp. NPDC092296]|uniref:carbon-nitrogen hydrolase family protein n=1 Tax=Streptomyces sp. NPDC092296 TaxID=3366012 RepID=UPI0037F122F9
MKVAVAQFEPTGTVSDNQTVITRMTAAAAGAGAGLIVFPEEAMLSADHVDTPLVEAAAAAWPGFVAHLSAVAREHGVAVIAGGYEADATTPDLPYNSLVAVDADGTVLATYRKMHLYDAFSYQESRRVLRGDAGPCVVRIGDFNVGLVNCYDIRFPEFTRTLVEMGADLLSVSAAWVRGPLKEDHWATLLRSRAIENTCWVVASSLVSDDCIGMSMTVDPLGVVRGALGEEREGLLLVDIDQERLDEARTRLPVLRNRRIFIQGR